MRFCSGCKKYVDMSFGCFNPKTGEMFCEECTIKMDKNTEKRGVE